jgi:hypothetical protein
MGLFGNGNIFNTIKKEYEISLKKLDAKAIEKIKGGKGNPLAFFNSKFYRIFTSSMFKALNSLEKGNSRQYYKYLNQSAGDYSKRKGGNIAESMRSHADFIRDFLKKNNDENLRYSLLGIFTDIADILDNQKWKSAFKRAFGHVDKVGATNTMATALKTIYMSLVITFETIGLKLLSFEYDLHSGIDPKMSVLNIMTRHSSFMKSVVIPMIKVIAICQNLKDPLSVLNEFISDENKAVDAKKRAREAGYPYKPEENGLSVVEVFKIEQMDNSLFKNRKRSSEAVGPIAAITVAIQAMLGTGTTAGVAGGTIFGLTVSAATGTILIFSAIVILLIIAVPLSRLIIYWVNVKKVDVQKELEMQAELLSNNIVLLQEKLEKTSDKEERARLQNIINKQIEMLVKLQQDIRKYLDEEYEASIDAEKLAENDDNNRGDSDDADDEFEVAI